MGDNLHDISQLTGDCNSIGRTPSQQQHCLTLRLPHDAVMATQIGQIAYRKASAAAGRDGPVSKVLVIQA